VRRSQELGWSSIAYVFLFVIGALILLTFLFRNLPEMQGAFSDTICKMNAWMRASTIGSPLMQSLLSVGGFFAGGFGSVSALSMNMPLACEPGQPINKPFPVGLSDVLDKIGTESVRCWDNFGGGYWDPLVFYSQGQFFKCYEELITVSCTESDARALVYDEQTFNEGYLPTNASPLDRAFMNYYYKNHQIGFAGFNKTFSQALPKGFPYYEVSDYDKILCDGEEHTYFVGLYFVDSFHGTLSGASFVPLICTTIDISSVGSDLIVLCTQDLTGKEVVI